MSQIEKVRKMGRIRVIDTARGIAIFGMVIGHMLNWWLTEQDFWLYDVLSVYLFCFGAASFIFISGASAAISLKRGYMEIEKGDKFFMRLIKKMYFLRAFLLLIISLIYNFVVALAFQDFMWIWSWNFLQTIAISLFLIWPLLKTSKIFRTIVGIMVLIINELLLAFLLPFQGQLNFYGVVFYILYNPLYLYILLPFFSAFVFGTVLGDILHNLNLIEDLKKKKATFKTHLIVSSLLGMILLITGMFFLPDFTIHASFASMTYSLGLILVVYSILMYYEIFEPIKLKEKHRFFYYYNYYSFTIFIAHNPLYFLFYRQLTVITIWIPIIITMIIVSILVIIVYKKLGPKASITVGISVISFFLATTKEQRKMLIKMKKERETGD